MAAFGTLLVAARVAGEVPQIGPNRGYAFAIVRAGGLPALAQLAHNNLKESRITNADGSEDMTLLAGDAEVLHFGPGLSQSFFGSAGILGFARTRAGAVRLYASAGARVLPFPRVVLGRNPLQAFAGVAIAGAFADVLVPPATTGKPFGSPTTLTLGATFECSPGSSSTQSGLALQTRLGLTTTVGAGLFQLDGTTIDEFGSQGSGCGWSAGRTISGLTVGTPVTLYYSAGLLAGAIAGNDLPVNAFTGAADGSAEGIGLNTGYVLVTDADGNGVTGQSGFYYGAPPPPGGLTPPTTSTTTTTFIPPTTLPTCAQSAYCGDGVHQADCGEACECPPTSQGDTVLACNADASVPALAPSCSRCVACQVDLAPCGIATTTSTTTTTPGTPTSTTTTLAGGTRCAELVGVAAIDCICAAPLPVACAGRTLPSKVQKGRDRACTQGRASAGAGAKKARRLVGKASRTLGSLVTAVGKPKLARKLSPGCASALGATFTDLKARVEGLRPRL